MLFRRIEILRWEVIFLFDYEEINRGSVLRQLVNAGAPDSVLHRISEKIEDGNMDEGFTYPNPERQIAVVGVGHASSGPEFLSSFCHELRHLTDAIASDKGIPLRGEKVSYLTGEISRKVADAVCVFSCPYCRHE